MLTGSALPFMESSILDNESAAIFLIWGKLSYFLSFSPCLFLGAFVFLSLSLSLSHHSELYIGLF